MKNLYSDSPHTNHSPDNRSPNCFLEERWTALMFFVSFLFLCLLAWILRWVDHTGIKDIDWLLLARFYIFLWSLFFFESLWLYFRHLKNPNRGHFTVSGLIWTLIFPPFRMGRRSPCLPMTSVLPGLGRVQINNELREKLEHFFELPMLFFVLLIIPLLAAETFWQESIANNPTFSLTVDFCISIIWIAFVIEFIVLAGVAEKKLSYCKEHWLDLIIILLPFVAFLRAFRIFKISRLHGRIMRIFRLLLIKKIVQSLELYIIDRILGVIASIIILLTVLQLFVEFEDSWIPEATASYYSKLQGSHGINPGYPIKLSGVTIGQVIKTQLYPDGSIHIEHEILDKYRHFITQGGYFEIPSPGLGTVLETPALHYTPGKQRDRKLPIESKIEIIVSEAITKVIDELDLAKLNSDFQHIMNNMDNIMAHVNDITTKFDEDQKNILISLKNIDSISGNIALTTDELPMLMKQLDQSMALLSQVIENFNKLLPGMQDEAKDIFSNTDNATATLETSLQEVSKLADHVSFIIANIQKNSSEIPEILLSGRAVIQNAVILSEKLNQHWIIREKNNKTKTGSVKPLLHQDQ